MVGLGVNIGYVPLDLVPEDEMRDALEKELHPLHTLSKNGFQKEIILSLPWPPYRVNGLGNGVRRFPDWTTSRFDVTARNRNTILYAGRSTLLPETFEYFYHHSKISSFSFPLCFIFKLSLFPRSLCVFRPDTYPHFQSNHS